MGTPKGIFGKEASTNLQALPVETPRGIPLGIPLGWGVGGRSKSTNKIAHDGDCVRPH